MEQPIDRVRRVVMLPLLAGGLVAGFLGFTSAAVLIYVVLIALTLAALWELG